jgi:hypothetical protein
MVQQPLVGQDLLVNEASRSHSYTLHSVGPLWTSDQPDAETSTWQHTTLTRNKICMRPTGFEPIILASEWPQTDALGHAATWILKTIILRIWRNPEIHFVGQIRNFDATPGDIHTYM